MSDWDDLVKESRDLGEEAINAIRDRFRAESLPKAIELTQLGLELSIRKQQGQDVDIALTAVESQLSDLGVEERLNIAQVQYDILSKLLTRLSILIVRGAAGG